MVSRHKKIKKNCFRQWCRQVDGSRQLPVLPQLPNCRQSWQLRICHLTAQSEKAIRSYTSHDNNQTTPSLPCSSCPSSVSKFISVENFFSKGEFATNTGWNPVNHRCLVHPHFRAHVQLNVCSLGDRVQHSSFCGFCMLVICWTDQPVNRYRWMISPVPAGRMS